MIESMIGRCELNENNELDKFKASLTEQIENARELFFYYADNCFERADNTKTEKREEGGEREFDYKNSISKLTSNLASMELEERGKVRDYLNRKGINYTIKGIFISGYINGPETLLFADFAENPLRYLQNGI